MILLHQTGRPRADGHREKGGRADGAEQQHEHHSGPSIPQTRRPRTDKVNINKNIRTPNRHLSGKIVQIDQIRIFYLVKGMEKKNDCLKA